MAGKKIDIMESELERENSGLLLVSDLLDGKSDEMLIGESGFVSLQSQLPLPASDLADGKNDPATSDTSFSIHLANHSSFDFSELIHSLWIDQILLVVFIGPHWSVQILHNVLSSFDASHGDRRDFFWGLSQREKLKEKGSFGR